MPLQKQPINLPFALGLDTKTDAWQVQPGKLLTLENAVFDTAGRLEKRNGFGSLPSLLSLDAKTLVTFGDDLMAIGTTLQLFVPAAGQWINRGSIQPVDLSVIPAVRIASSITSCDVAMTPQGLACSTFVTSSGAAGYQITDTSSGQIVFPITLLPTTAAAPRVFLLDTYFVVTFIVTVPFAGTHLQYIAIPIAHPVSPTAPADLLTSLSGLSAGYDGVVANNTLYVAASGSTAILMTGLDTTFINQGTTTIAGYTASLVSLAADLSGNTPVIWITAFNTADAYSWTFDKSLIPLTGPFHTISTETAVQVTSAAASAGVLTLFYEIYNTYPSTVRSDYIKTKTVTSAGVVSSPAVLARSVGLASKAAVVAGRPYVLSTYAGAYQPSYFLLDGITGAVLGKLAYSNGGGYVAAQVLPSAAVNSSVISIGYLYKNLLIPVNKAQDAPAVAGVYAQLGVNLASFNMGAETSEAEIAGSLHLTGGLLWQYDGFQPVEHGFNLWPEDVTAAWATTGGHMKGQPLNIPDVGPSYFYQVTYEWTDSKGFVHRSAPGVPVAVSTGGSSTTTGAVTLVIPTLRMTSKTSVNNPVRIVIYRWSTGQSVYYQVTSVSAPRVNDPTIDYVTYFDTLVDSDIIGNAVIYTTGGVAENIGAPAAKAVALFKSRLFLIDAEDPDLLWFSKQVIEATPVEMSDLFTRYVAPTTGSQGSTGPTECAAPMDDKLILFKKNAIYYITGDGPDNTGANNDFSEPTYITSTIGCDNQGSIVMMPQGLMFQSDKGIWLLGRDLSTNYIGAPVEAYNNSAVISAVSVPGTNQVRFMLDSGITLVYDYYYQQWGTFTNIPALSGTIFDGLHTFINSRGQTFQETPGAYLDGASPVLLKFQTAWLHLAGLQGYHRAYFFYLLGKYISPHKLSIQIAYDYDPAIQQATVIAPDNYSPPYGGATPYGAGIYGGPSAVEQSRIFLKKEKCQAVQITVAEMYDGSFGVMPGAGFTLSGLNMVVGVKKGYTTLRPTKSVS